MQRMVVNEHPIRPESLGIHYGFTRNPYDPSPLRNDPDDATLFVGREREGALFRTFLKSFDRGGIVVEGGTGVGKTSFANVQEFREGGTEPATILSPRQPIQLASALNPVEFMLSVTSNVLSSLRTMDPASARDAGFRKLSVAVTQTIQKSRGWEAYAAGFGGGYSSQTSVSNPLLVLLSAVSDQLEEAGQLAVRRGIEKIVVNVNNLDVIEPQALVTFLDTVRDLILTRQPFLWVFLGPVGSRALIAQRTRRVSELLRTDPIGLPPLSLDEVRSAVAARVKRFRSGALVRPPISDEVLRTLYESSSGEVRYILNRCTDLLLRTMIEFPTTPEISLELALPMLERITSDTVERLNLTEKQQKILREIAHSGPCQPREFGRFGFQSAPAFLRYLSRFYELGLVDRRRRQKIVVYTPRGDVVLSYGGGKRGASTRAPPTLEG